MTSATKRKIVAMKLSIRGRNLKGSSRTPPWGMAFRPIHCNYIEVQKLANWGKEGEKALHRMEANCVKNEL